MHDHHHGVATGRRLWISAALTGAFVLVEFAVGWWANSLALISDAGHNLTDAAALVLSAWAFALATRPADQHRSFGFHRAGVLVALVNAATLIVLAAYIFYEAYHRLLQPEPVQSLPMVLVAAVALALNGGIVHALRHSHDDVNVRSAFVHMVGDALSSAGVILAGVAVWLTGSPVWDPLVSLIRRVKQVLADRHGIAHATLETHCSDGDTDCLPCEIHPHKHVHVR